MKNPSLKSNPDAETPFSRDKLVMDVVHKIKNGLGGIGGFAGLLERDIPANDPKLRLIHKIQDGVQKVNEISVGLMTLVQDVDSAPERIHLFSLLKEVWGNIHADDMDVPGTGMNQPFQITGQKVEVRADAQRLQRLLHYTMRFIQDMGCRMPVIHVSPKDSREYIIEFRLECQKDGAWPDLPVPTLMETLEPVQVRLSLAIMDKMIRRLQGRMDFDIQNDRKRTIRFTLNKG